MIQPAIRTLAVALLTALAAFPALAQTASAPPTRVSGVVVTAPAPTLPMVVSTYPANGKAIAPGVVILTVTFDQKMNPDGWDYGKGADPFPQCLDRPRLLADEKTFVLLCTAGGAGKFSIALNSSAAGSGGFENMAGQKATPAAVSFTTDDGTSIANIAEALKAAGLKPDQGPVMDDRPAALATVAH